MIQLPEKCLRERDDCEPLSQIQSDCGETFICCGHNHLKSRSCPEDRFRVCFKSVTTDTCYDYDNTDMKDTISVMSVALSVDERIT